MSKLTIPVSSKFDIHRAIESSKLIKVAYEQFDCYESHQRWKPIVSKNPTDSETCEDILTALNRDSNLFYSACTVLSFTENTLFNPKTIPSGFITQRKLENGTLGVFIVFRGTRTLPELINNFQTNQETCLNNQQLGLVCSGVQNIYTRANKHSKSLQQSIAETLKNLPPNAQIFITGHSFGAALATLATIHIASQTAFKQPILYTFGSPRVGDANFAKQFNHLEHYRIANSEDFVPAIPISIGKLSKLFSSILFKQIYQHVGDPLYFTKHEEYMTDNHDINVYCGALNSNYLDDSPESVKAKLITTV